MSSQSVFPSDAVSLVRFHLREVLDFPTPGVLFRDITPLITDPQAFKVLIETITRRYRGQVDAVVGLESRGFILGAPLTIEMGVGMLTVRKGGRFPGPVVGVDYGLEYGSARMELQPFTIADGQRILVVGDILTTGGTASAAFELIERTDDILTRLCVLIEFRGLGGRERLAGRKVDAVLAYWPTVMAYSRHRFISVLQSAITILFWERGMPWENQARVFNRV